MSCHTWGYKKLEDFTKEEFERIKQDCDEVAEKTLSDTRTAEEINALIKRYHGDNCETLYQTRKRLDIRRKEAEYYKANIDSNPSLIKIYKEYRIFNGCPHLRVGTLDYYIRINNYPTKVFTKPNSMIRFCYKNGWKHVCWFDDNDGHLVRANRNIREAKERITRMFSENKGVLVTFG